MAESAFGNQTGTSANAGGYSSDPYARDLGGEAGNWTRQAQDTYEQAKGSAADTFAKARQTLTDVSRQAQQAASEWTQQTRSATESYVRDKPWNAVGIAAGIGLLVGLILRR